MLLAKKLNLSRFKKNAQGLIEFAMIIEQADRLSRERIIAQAEQQDPDLLTRAMKKVVYFEELIYLDETILAEILANTTGKVLAYALWETPEDFRTAVLKQMGQKELRALKDEEERLSSKTEKGLILGAQKQIIKIGRQLEKKQKFLFELTTCPRFQKRRKPAPIESEENQKLAANDAKK
jgi:flagellar motor switch protein FliG